MTIRMNAALRRLPGGVGARRAHRLRRSFPPQWRNGCRPGGPSPRRRHRAELEAQGYVLIAPLQRRPGVYLADVRAGPAGYQRLVIDDRNGEILERFSSRREASAYPPRRFGSRSRRRYGGVRRRPPPGVVRAAAGPG